MTLELILTTIMHACATVHWPGEAHWGLSRAWFSFYIGLSVAKGLAKLPVTIGILHFCSFWRNLFHFSEDLKYNLP